MIQTYDPSSLFDNIKNTSMWHYVNWGKMGFLCKWDKYLKDMDFTESLRGANTWKEKMKYKPMGLAFVEEQTKLIVLFAYKTVTERIQVTLCFFF